MMTFRTVKTALKTILEDNAGTNYQVVGGQRQSKAAVNIVDLPLVQLFYESGSFPKSGGSMQTDKKHDASFRAEITVAKNSEVDLSVLTNPASTAPQIAAALAAMPDLSDECDDAWDKAFDDVYQVLMDARNHDLDLPNFAARDMWIDQVQKGQPLPKGQSLVLPGSIIISITMTETVSGLTGTLGTTFDITTNIKDDQPDQAGSEGTLGG